MFRHWAPARSHRSYPQDGTYGYRIGRGASDAGDLGHRDRGWARLLHGHRAEPSLRGPGDERERRPPAPVRFENSLSLFFLVIFLAAPGWSDFNDQQAAHGEPTVSWLTYIGSSTFWESTLQNWQSEFLAVGSFAVLTIYLRQRGSPESKPVGAPMTDATGKEG
jgi:Domain of unknown function (DUF6766)